MFTTLHVVCLFWSVWRLRELRRWFDWFLVVVLATKTNYFWSPTISVRDRGDQRRSFEPNHHKCNLNIELQHKENVQFYLICCLTYQMHVKDMFLTALHSLTSQVRLVPWDTWAELGAYIDQVLQSLFGSLVPPSLRIDPPKRITPPEDKKLETPSSSKMVFSPFNTLMMSYRRQEVLLL